MEFTINIGDLITGGTLLVSIVAFIYKMKSDKEKQDIRIHQIESGHGKDVEDLKEKIMSVQHGKKAMKKELIEGIEKMEGVLHGRIDRVRDDNIKSYEKLEIKIGHLETKYDTNTEKLLQAISNMK